MTKSAEYARRYRERHPERWRAYDRAYKERNHELLLARRRAWGAANPEKIREYRERTAVRHSEQKKALYARNRDLMLARTLAYQQAHPEVRAAKVNRYRARLVNAVGSHTAQEWQEKLELFAYCCVYCGESKPLTRDHNVPLFRGGSDEISNILPACGSCNAKKGTNTANEFIAMIQNRPAMTGGRTLMLSAR